MKVLLHLGKLDWLDDYYPFSRLIVAYFEIQLCLGTVHFDWKEDANKGDKDHGIFNDTSQPWGPMGIMFK